jgi:hypothetical protein
MLEGLKNTSPTFCRMTKAILKEQMEKNIFAYVDDIVVASRKMKLRYKIWPRLSPTCAECS